MNKTATSSSHHDSEYDTASDSQSSDEADQKAKPVGNSGGASNSPAYLVELTTFPPGEKNDENDLNDDADGEADDDEER